MSFIGGKLAESGHGNIKISNHFVYTCKSLDISPQTKWHHSPRNMQNKYSLELPLPREMA
jgi:hypothetical protein